METQTNSYHLTASSCAEIEIFPLVLHLLNVFSSTSIPDSELRETENHRGRLPAHMAFPDIENLRYHVQLKPSMRPQNRGQLTASVSMSHVECNKDSRSNLFDDRSCVQIRRRVVRGSTDDLYPASVRLVVGLGSHERWQKATPIFM